MFANTFQSGFISIFYSVGSNPLSLWDKQVKNGHIRRVVDDEAKSLVLELSGTNVATTYITCPIKPRASLGIKLPFLVMVIKNMKKYFTFEIQILDDKDMHRRFRVSNFQSTTKVRPFCTTMPIGLSGGWNQIQFNLADFTRRAYGTVYRETMRVQIHANIRIRRIYFADRLYADHEMPNEFKLVLPGTVKAKDTKRPSKEEVEKKVAAAGAAVPAPASEAVPAPPPTTVEAPKEEEEKIQPEEPELPTGAPPTPIESVADAEEKHIEVVEELPVMEEAPAEGSEAAPTEEVHETAAPAEGEEEAAAEAPTEAAEGEEAPAEAPAAEEIEAAPAEAVEESVDQNAEGGEVEAPSVTESTDVETPAESPIIAGETTGDESPTEIEPVAAETPEAPVEDIRP